MPTRSTLASDTIGIRTEPAHDVAYTRLTKAQFSFPEILGAYDAVADLARGQRAWQLGDKPREIYMGQWGKLADDDPAGDVAFPAQLTAFLIARLARYPVQVRYK